MLLQEYQSDRVLTNFLSIFQKYPSLREAARERLDHKHEPDMNNPNYFRLI